MLTLLAESLSHLDEFSANWNVLRTNFFARAAFYTFAGILFAMHRNQPAILIGGELFIFVKRQDIVRREGTAYADILRTNFREIIASRAGDYRNT